MELYKVMFSTGKRTYSRIFNGLEAAKAAYMQLRDEAALDNTDCAIEVWPMRFDGAELVPDGSLILLFRNSPKDGYRKEKNCINED